MPNSLVIESSALDIMQATFDVQTDWFQSFESSQIHESVRLYNIGESLYFIGPKATESSKLLIINIKSSGLFRELTAKNREEAFLRILRIGKLSLTPGKLIPPTKWAPYHAGSILSIQSNHNYNNEKARIEIDLNPQGTSHTYVYNLDKKQRDINNISVDYEPFDDALYGFDDALLKHFDFTDRQKEKKLLCYQVLSTNYH